MLTNALAIVKPPPGKAEPRLGAVIAELGGTQFDNFESWFQGQRHFPGRPARRTGLSRAAFGGADEAQPEASRNKGRRDQCGEPRAFLQLIEDMEAAAVEDELKRILERRAGKKGQSSEAAIEIVLGQLRGSFFDGERGDIDAEHVEPALGQPKGVGPGSRADLQSPGRLNATRSDECDQQRFGFPGVPGKISRCVTLIPGTMRHYHKFNAQSWR